MKRMQKESEISECNSGVGKRRRRQDGKGGGKKIIDNHPTRGPLQFFSRGCAYSYELRDGETLETVLCLRHVST